METLFSTVSSDQLDTWLIKKAYRDVINSYLWFLRTIGSTIVNETTDDINRETRKFNTVRKELSEFLFKHRRCYQLKTIIVKV